MRNYLGMMVLLGLASACNSPGVYHGKFDFEYELWPPDEEVIFDMEVPEAEVPYDLYYQVRHARDYAYQNLYVRITVQDSTGQVLKAELQNIPLFDAKTGKPMGSGYGSTLSREIRALRNLTFAEAGTYTVRLLQRNREGEAEGIRSLGIWLEEVNE